MQKSQSKDQYGPPLGPETPEKNKGKEVVKAPPPIQSYPPLQGTTSRLLINPNIKPNTTIQKPTTFSQAIRSQIVRPPIIQNRYSPLQYTNTNTNTLITPKDFYKPYIPPTFQTNIEEDSSYIDKLGYIPLLIAEKPWLKNTPYETANRIFPLEHQYPVTHEYKNRTFYEFILIDTESVKITHMKDDAGVIQYSRLKILNIIPDTEWEQPLYTSKTFSRAFNPQGYNYYDYIEAWSKVLAIKPDKHSWFIWFRRGISLKFPKWFIKWFLEYGPTRAIFPPRVIEGFEFFKQHTTFVAGYRLISFIASQSISWIMAWSYCYAKLNEETDLVVLARQIKIKWWKRFDENLINKEKIIQWAEQNKKTQKVLTSEEREAQFLTEKNKLMAELAAAKSPQEFEEKLSKIKASSSDKEVVIKDEASSTGSNHSSPFDNKDMMDKFNLDFSE